MTVRLGIIGSGHMGRTYAGVIGADVGAQLVAIAGGTRAEALAADAGVASEPSVAALLARDDIDAVVIATPHSTHLPLTREAAAARRHVLIEKPMARTVAECDAMIEACEAAGVVLSVAKVSRTLGASVAARELIEGGAIGTVHMAESRRLRSGHVLELIGPKSWVDDPAEGGTFLDWGSHGCDIMRWIVGAEVELAFGRFDTFEPGNPLHASGMAQYTFADGTIAQLWMSHEVAAPMGARTRYTFVGSEGVLELHPFGRVSVGRAGAWEVAFERDGFGGPDAPADETLAYFQDGFAAQVRQFVDTLEGRAPLAVTGADGRAAIEMVEAAERSSASGASVRLRG